MLDLRLRAIFCGQIKSVNGAVIEFTDQTLSL